jgi:hypothetical protein
LSLFAFALASSTSHFGALALASSPHFTFKSVDQQILMRLLHITKRRINMLQSTLQFGRMLDS